MQTNYGNSPNTKPSSNRNNNNNRNSPPQSASQTSHESTTDLEDTRLKSLIREIRDAVGNTRRFWTKLPQSICDDVTRGSNDQSCWNGREAGKYLTPVVADGLLNQEHNGEVSVDVGRPDVHNNEQIFALKLITKKLESAHKGLNVDWPSSTSG